MFELKYGNDGKLYVVFADNVAAEPWHYFFCDFLGCIVSCFGGYENAYQL
jgi:hypothetical protein